MNKQALIEASTAIYPTARVDIIEVNGKFAYELTETATAARRVLAVGFTYPTAKAAIDAAEAEADWHVHRITRITQI